MSWDKPGVHTNDFAPIYDRRVRIPRSPAETIRGLLIRRIVFRRRAVNTRAATVNRSEIVSMYAGLGGEGVGGVSDVFHSLLF